MILGDLIQDIAQRFDAAGLSYGHGTDNSWDEAVYLVLSVTGCADDEQELAYEVDPQIAGEISPIAASRSVARWPTF